jgi:DNA-binding response OmpR family regulator
VPGSLILVLPAEDDRPSSVVDLLRDTNHRVRPARDLEEAVRALGQDAFDLVLLDLNGDIPDATGALQRLKCDGRVWHIPVIALGSPDEVDAVVRCIELGADDYVLGPLNPVLLSLRINTFLAKKRLQEVEAEYIKIFEEQSAELHALKRELANLRTAGVSS